MQIAIAGMKDVADGERVLLGDLFNLAQSFGHAGARNNAILHVERWRDAANGAKSVLASRPQTLSLSLVFSSADFAGVLAAADFTDSFGLLGHSFAQT